MQHALTRLRQGIDTAHRRNRHGRIFQDGQPRNVSIRLRQILSFIWVQHAAVFQPPTRQPLPSRTVCDILNVAALPHVLWRTLARMLSITISHAGSTARQRGKAVSMTTIYCRHRMIGLCLSPSLRSQRRTPAIPQRNAEQDTFSLRRYVRHRTCGRAII